jgi:hypothetical protein
MSVLPAYRFDVELPTLGEFVTRVTREYGAELEVPRPLVGAKRSGPRRLQRTVNGKTLRVDVPDLRMDDLLLRQPLAALCEGLGIHPQDFGLILG